MEKLSSWKTRNLHRINNYYSVVKTYKVPRIKLRHKNFEKKINILNYILYSYSWITFFHRLLCKCQSIL